MTYDADEIEGGVTQIVQGSPSFTRDGLGGRNVKDRFDATRELVNSVLLYEPDSVFYLIYKSVLKARTLLTGVLSIIDDLESDISDMAVPARAVLDTAALADAGTALTNISGALARRGSISEAEYTRYDRATSRALGKFRDAARRTYTPFGGTTATTDVVKSSAEAAASLNSNYTTFQASYASLLLVVETILGSLDDYAHRETVRAVASRQVDRLKDEMASLERSFDAATPDERASTARADTLTVLTNRAAVRALANVREPGAPKLVQSSTGVSRYRFAAYGTGTPPAIAGTVSGPWPITAAHNLTFQFNAVDPPVAVPLIPVAADAVQPITPASVTSGSAEQAGLAFAINQDLATPWSLLTPNIGVGGTYAVTGTFLYLMVDGVPFRISDDIAASPPTVAFTGARTAVQLAGDINFHAGTHVTATAQTGGGSDWVDIAYGPPAAPPMTYNNRYIQASTGPNHAAIFDGNWRVDVNGVPTAGELSNGWDGSDELWIWPNDIAEANLSKVALTNGTWPGYVRTAGQVAADITADPSVEFIGGIDMSGHVVITSTDQGEGSILKLPFDVMAGGKKSVSQVTSETLGFYEDQEDRRTDVDALAIVEVLNNHAGFSANATASLVKQELFTSKQGTAVAPNQVTVAADVDPSTGWTLATTKFVIESGENEGVYGVSAIGYVAPTLTFTLDRNLRDVTVTGFRVQVYTELMHVTALSSAITSYIDVDELAVGSAHAVVGLPTTLTRGTVEQVLVQFNDPVQGWIPADLRFLGIKIGDVILDEEGTLITAITGVGSLSTGVIDVSPVAPTLSVTAFSIQSVAADVHTAFIASLQTWQDNLSDEEESLSALTRRVSALLTISNPDRGRVQAAATALQAIRDQLEGTTKLSGLLAGFSITPVPAVDRALDVMTQQGHDRARDLLTDGKFSDFQETDYKSASTAGAMMAASSAVAVSDLIAPTKTRKEYDSEIDRIVFSTQSDIDPKYDFRDIRPETAPIYLGYFSAATPRSKG